MIGSLAKLNRMLVFLLIMAWTGNAYCAAGKVIRNVNVGVTFEIDGEGKLQSLDTILESNRVLLPMLQEKFATYQFAPRMHAGLPVSARLQAIVPMQAKETKGGLVSIEFKDPQFQAVKIGGENFDFVSLGDFVSKPAVTFDVTIKIKPDGTVSECIVKTKGLRDAPEATAMIKKAISTWTYAVDSEAGVPVAMVAEFNFRIGTSRNIQLMPLGRPMHNPTIQSMAPIKR